MTNENIHTDEKTLPENHSDTAPTDMRQDQCEKSVPNLPENHSDTVPTDVRQDQCEKSAPNLSTNTKDDTLLPQMQRCQRFETALVLTAQEEFAKGISTPNSRDFLYRRGLNNIDAESMKRAKTNLDQSLEKWRHRPGLIAQPIVWMVASRRKALIDKEPCPIHLVTAMGINDKGNKQILAVELMAYTDKYAWKDILLAMRQRGVRAIGCLVAPAYTGLQEALAETFPRAIWQQCTLSLIDEVMNAMSHPRSLIRHFLKEIFQQPREQLAMERATPLLQTLSEQDPEAAALLRSQLPHALQFHCFPGALPPSKKRCTSLLRGTLRRIHANPHIPFPLPSQSALLRLYAAALIEMDEDWYTRRALVNPKNLRKVFLPWLPPEKVENTTDHTDGQTAINNQ